MSKKEQVEVIIDSNEISQKPKMGEVLILHEDVEDYQIEPLETGDFIIGNCIFERKSPNDFAGSLEEGRLREQVERLAEREEVPFVMVEGNVEDFENLTHTDIPPKSLRGMDASIEMRNNISVKYCSKIETLVDLAVRLSRKQKEEMTNSQARQSGAVRDTTFLEDVFRAIDGIGIKTASNLSAEFSDLSDAINSTRERFETVEGVGPETSEKIAAHLHSNDNTKENNHTDNTEVYTV